MKHKLIRDPEFERFVPPLSDKEREILEESILHEGCRDAIVVWNDVILDGHNRYAICMKHDIPFQVRNLQMDSRDEAIAWIWRNIIYPAVVFMVGLPEVITGLMFKRIEEE